MLDTIEQLIEYHISMISKIFFTTQKILELGQKENIDELMIEVQNRERSIKIVQYVQDKVEKKLQLMHAEEFTAEILQQIKNWQEEIKQKLILIEEFDQKINTQLEKDKEKYGREIGKIYQYKSAFKSYHLNGSAK